MITKHIQQKEWETEVLGKFNTDNYFQTHEWQNITSKHFSLSSQYYLLQEGEESYYISLQCKEKVAFSPFIGYSQIFTNSQLTFEKVNEIQNILKKNDHISIPRLKIYPFQEIRGDAQGFSVASSAILLLKDSYEEQEKHMHKNTRTSIRYAAKNGVTVHPIEEDMLESFYDIYLRKMQEVNSMYITPKEFFRDIVTLPGAIFLGAYKNNELIGGSVFFEYNNGIFYWWNAASTLGQKLCGNYAMINFMVKYGIEHKKKFLDMASSHTPLIEEPKLKWGAIKYPVYIKS